MLELKNLNYTIDNKKIVNDVSYSFEKGNIYIITGPNGGGKTSLGKLITGLYQTNGGSITYDGKDITKLSISDRAKMGISYAFQTPVYFKGLTVGNILSLSSKNNDLKTQYDLLANVGLCGRDYIDRDLDDRLSGGEIKRIELASVLAKPKTEIYIFDEPEAGIDLWSFKEIIRIFKQLRKQNKTIIIVSHQERILMLSDYILLVKDGKIAKEGPTSEILPTLIQPVKLKNCNGCIRKELI